MKNMKDRDTAGGEEFGLTFRKQLFGGYRKMDVVNYIDDITALVKEEREKLEGRKRAVYDLMEKGKLFSDELVAKAEARAEEITKEAEHKVEQTLNGAKEEIASLYSERARIFSACRIETDNLLNLLSRDRIEIEKSCEKMTAPLEELSRLLGSKKE